ncbi:hypothetical protein HYFRA_00005459 [Hymenoscyphus fraxineus]|uniref:Extracellular membrane protein CFEM domain-containing protein n=1 Tax=Hymenoscyphus fraxineus TaxID=746836 RepID=A0A9N9KPT6_9HELO|nr:hypothetical protein HYFRA_00005459 [Hymenoscyphus fraxineus]
MKFSTLIIALGLASVSIAADPKLKRTPQSNCALSNCSASCNGATVVACICDANGGVGIATCRP